MASEPTPEDELPPRLRFERMVKGPEPHVFRSVRPDPDPDPDSNDGKSPDSELEIESDASILARFDALKQTLSRELGQYEPSIEPEPDRDSDEPESTPPSGSLDDLQSRVQEMKRQEREASLRMEQSELVAEPGEAAHAYDELEKLEQAEADESQAKKKKRRQRRQTRSFWKELPILIVVALVVAIVIKTFFFQAFYIPSGSMIPTLEVNDRVLVNKLSYRFGAVERGDILVFDSPEAHEVNRSFLERAIRSIGEATGLTSPDTVLIKRVIGLPGETVEVKENQVYVNGNPIAEPYLPDGVTMRDEPEVTIPADSVFMMGDNRNASNDSRRFGAIPREDIVGRAFVTVWPPGAWSGL